MVRILLSVDCLVRNVVRCDVLCVDETDIGTVKAPVLTAKANTRINHRERIFMLLTVSICVVCSVCFPCIGGPIDRHLVLCWVVMVRFAGVPDPQTTHKGLLLEETITYPLLSPHCKAPHGRNEAEPTPQFPVRCKPFSVSSYFQCS